MRGLLAFVLLAFLVALARPVSAQERARDLDRPYRSADPRRPSGARGPLPAPRTEPDALPPPQPAPLEPGAVQSLTAQPAAGVGPRVFGDGRGDALAWDDPELDLRPRGVLHLVIGASGAWLGATESFDESGGGTVSLALDLVLEPRLSLHLRAGATATLRTETRRTEGPNELRSAVLSVRGTALLGVHLAQLVAFRAGVEIGEGRSFVLARGDAGTLGFAFVGQAGVRLAGGGVELGVEAAAELREGSVIAPAGPGRSIQELAPRLGAYLGLTL